MSYPIVFKQKDYFWYMLAVPVPGTNLYQTYRQSINDQPMGEVGKWNNHNDYLVTLKEIMKVDCLERIDRLTALLLFGMQTD